MNIFNGWESGFSAGGGALNYNIGLGEETLHAAHAVGVESNIAIGRASMYRLVLGVGNVAIGVSTMRMLLQGSYNAAWGSDALHNAVNASRNLAIGYDALHDLTEADDNVAIGHHAGYDVSGSNSNQTGEKNVWIGNFSGVSVSEQVHNSVAIGYGSKNTKSNQVVLGNEDTEEVVIAGVAISKTKLISLLALL